MSHIIKKQILALDVPSGSGSWRFQNQVRDTFNQEVLPRLEKVCKELDLGDDITLKIDKLHIDVGQISSSSFDATWADSIASQFRDQIKLLQQPGKTTAHKAQIEASEQSHMTALIGYLTKGVLPWWVSKEMKLSPGLLLREALETQPHALISALKRVGNKKLLAARIIKQSKTDIVLRLFSLLGVEKPASAQLKSLCKSLKISIEKKHLLSLNITELAALLEAPRKEISEVLSLWISEIRQQGNFKSITLTQLQKQLINNELKEIETEVAKGQFLKSLKRLLTKSVTDSGFSSVAGKADLSASVHKDKTGKKSNPLSPKISSKNQKENQRKQGEAEANTFSKNQANQPPKSSTNSEEKSGITKPLPSSSEPHIDDKSQDGRNRKTDQSPKEISLPSNTTKTDKAQRLTAEDQHVFDQLKRIREAAQKKQGSLDEGEQIEAPIEAQSKGEISETESKANQKTTSSNELTAKQQEERNLSADTDSKTQGTDSKAKEADEPQEQQLTATARPYYPYDLSGAEAVEECYVENAGLILFWPFLGHFFKDFGLMESGQFVNLEAQEKAALILQYLLSEEPELEEYLLPLNKLLCDLPIEHPLSDQLSLSQEELILCQELLESTVSNWTALKGTSIPGFQGSFLHRNGVLRKRENGWLLQVEKMAFDILLEQLPWPLSIVRLSWMNEPIYVEW